VQHQHHVGQSLDGAQTLTVQGHLPIFGGGVRIGHLDETVNAPLQLLAVLIRADTADRGAAVHIGNSIRAGTLALCHIHGQRLATARIVWV